MLLLLRLAVHENWVSYGNRWITLNEIDVYKVKLQVSHVLYKSLGPKKDMHDRSFWHMVLPEENKVSGTPRRDIEIALLIIPVWSPFL